MENNKIRFSILYKTPPHPATGCGGAVLLLNFHSPQQENFINNNKHLLHVRLCVCMGDGIRSKYPVGLRISKLKGLLDQTLFKRKIMKYNESDR